MQLNSMLHIKNKYMVNHLIYTLIISLSCIGINVTTWDGMIFNSLAKHIHKIIAKILYLFTKNYKYKVIYDLSYAICMPLFYCPICMASFWSFSFWLYFGFSFNLPLMMLTVCGLNVILIGIYHKIMPE